MSDIHAAREQHELQRRLRDVRELCAHVRANGPEEPSDDFLRGWNAAIKWVVKEMQERGL